MTANTQHVNPKSLVFDFLDKVNAGPSKYDDKKLSVFYLMAELIMRMDGYGNQIIDLADESGAFSEVQSAAQKVDRDVIRIQKWKADPKNKDKTLIDAINDPEFKANVDAFKKDMEKFKEVSSKYNMNKKYRAHGMDEAFECYGMIASDKIPWRDDGKSMSIGDMIAQGKDKDLAAAMFYGAAHTTADGGVFHRWTDGDGGGIGGKPSLKMVEQDFGNLITKMNGQLNVLRTNNEMVDQTGQSSEKGLSGMIGRMIGHFNDR